MTKHHKHDKHTDVEGELPDNEKLAIPSNILDLINSIVDDIGKVKDAVNAIGSGNWGAAVTSLLAVVENIIVNLVLPKLKAEQPNDQQQPGQDVQDQ